VVQPMLLSVGELHIIPHKVLHYFPHRIPPWTSNSILRDLAKPGQQHFLPRRPTLLLHPRHASDRVTRRVKQLANVMQGQQRVMPDAVWTSEDLVRLRETPSGAR
jgi:hypothetical protein